MRSLQRTPDGHFTTPRRISIITQLKVISSRRLRGEQKLTHNPTKALSADCFALMSFVLKMYFRHRKTQQSWLGLRFNFCRGDSVRRLTLTVQCTSVNHFQRITVHWFGSIVLVWGSISAGHHFPLVALVSRRCVFRQSCAWYRKSSIAYAHCLSLTSTMKVQTFLQCISKKCFWFMMTMLGKKHRHTQTQSAFFLFSLAWLNHSVKIICY